MFRQIVAGFMLASITGSAHAACGTQQVQLQVLGSGGPEFNDGRASSSYLIWVDDKARVLIDAGGGSSVNFEKSGAKIEDLQAVLFSHFHVDHSGDFPAVAWRVDINGCSVSFSADMNNQTGNLAKLAKNSDLLVAHNAIPEDTGGIARQLHMPPSEIGKIARQAKIESLLLSHRMNRTLGREAETRAEVGKHYRGIVLFANDLDKFDIDKLARPHSGQ